MSEPAAPPAGARLIRTEQEFEFEEGPRVFRVKIIRMRRDVSKREPDEVRVCAWEHHARGSDEQIVSSTTVEFLQRLITLANSTRSA